MSISGGTINRAILLGHLIRDPEFKTIKDDRVMVTLLVATASAWTTKDGIRQERVEVSRVIAFDVLARRAAKHLKKGSKVFVEGELCTRRWRNAPEPDTYVTEIALQGPSVRLVFLDPKHSAQDVTQVDDDLVDALTNVPVPLSIKRSAAKYGDGDGLGVDDDSAGLTRFLNV